MRKPRQGQGSKNPGWWGKSLPPADRPDIDSDQNWEPQRVDLPDRTFPVPDYADGPISEFRQEAERVGIETSGKDDEEVYAELALNSYRRQNPTLAHEDDAVHGAMADALANR